jgi:hypothetical protein
VDVPERRSITTQDGFSELHLRWRNAARAKSTSPAHTAAKPYCAASASWNVFAQMHSVILMAQTWSASSSTSMVSISFMPGMDGL